MDNLSQRIGNDAELLLSNWAFYIVVFVGIVCMVMIWDQHKTAGLINTLLDIARQLVSYILEAMMELVGAVRNLLGFTGALRYIFFGRLNNGVKFIIANYAVIFAMIVSASMIAGGLSELTGGFSAVAISIAIQGGFLLSVLWMVQLWIPEDEREKKIIRYFNIEKETEKKAEPGFLGKKKNIDIDAIRDKINKHAKTCSRKHIFLKRFFAFIITLLLLMVITLFSYIYLFQKRLERIAVFHSLYTVEKIAEKQEALCSEELKQYYRTVEQYLREYIRRVEDNYLKESDAPDVEKKECADELKNFLQNPQELLDQEDGYDWDALRKKFDELAEWVYNMETDQYIGKNKFIGEIYAFSDDFNEISQTNDTDLRYIRYVKENIINIFDNYQGLTQYFHEHTNGIATFSYESDITERLITTNKASIKKLEDTDIAGFREKLLDDVNCILKAYEAIPDCHDLEFYKITEATEDQNIDGYVRFKAFDSSGYTKDLKTIYRILNPNVLSIERAASSLRYLFVWDSAFALWMINFIVLLQLLVVLICFIRGGLINISTISEKRNLVRCLFVYEEKDDFQDLDLLRAAVIMGGTAVFVLWGGWLGIYKTTKAFFMVVLAGIFISDMLYLIVKKAMILWNGHKETSAEKKNGHNQEPKQDTDDDSKDRASVFTQYLTGYAAELINACEMRLLGKVESRVVSQNDPEDIDKFRENQMTFWKHNSNSFLIIEAKYRESENAGKTFRAKVHIILNPNSDSGKER